MLIFTLIITLGFVFEIARGALKINSRQYFQHKSQDKAIETISYLESKQLKNLRLDNTRISTK